MINWKVRIKNKAFWSAIIPAIIPAIFLVVQAVANVFGYTLELSDLGNKLLVVVNSVFSVLVIAGIVTDPTTEGLSDSEQALTYHEPKK
ncbi:TPA: phage holin [Streptococcus agalactiae]